MADKIGFVPNVRKSDNVWQAKFVGISVAVGTIIGVVCGLLFVDEQFGWLSGLASGLLASLILGALISGTILAIRRLRD